MSDTIPPPPQSIEEFLGTDDRPLWQRWAKVWIPLIVVLILLAAAIWYTRDSGKPQYVTAEVTRKSLDVEVTATGNLRPTNQVDVGSEVSGKIDAIYVDVNDRVTA